jgi:hypothetical protein
VTIDEFIEELERMLFRPILTKDVPPSDFTNSLDEII